MLTHQPGRTKSAHRYQLFLCLVSSAVLSGCAASSISNSLSNSKTNLVQSLVRIQTEGTESEALAFKNTQLELVKSKFVLRAALRPPEIAHNAILKEVNSPIAWLEKNIKAQYLGDSDILEVTLTSSDTKNAVAMLNAVVTAYLDEVAQAERSEFAERLDLLRSTHRKDFRDLQEMLDDLETIGAKVGDPESKLGSLNRQIKLDRVSQLARRVGALEDDLISAKLDCFEETGDLGTDSIADQKPSPSNLRCKALSAAISQQQKLLDEAHEELRGFAGFSAEAETKKMDVASVKQRVMEMAREIGEIEIQMRRRPRAQLVQPADTSGKTRGK